MRRDEGEGKEEKQNELNAEQSSSSGTDLADNQDQPLDSFLSFFSHKDSRVLISSKCKGMLEDERVAAANFLFEVGPAPSDRILFLHGDSKPVYPEPESYESIR